MAKLKEIRPMFWTKQLKETIEFYTKVLGFTCGAQSDDWGWAAVHRDDIEVMFAIPNEHTPFVIPVFSGSIYINVEDVESLWLEYKDKCKICYPIETFEYGMREFAIYDNNGYLLQFGQEAPIN